MKTNLKVIIAVFGAVVLAAAFPFLVWKLTAHAGADRPAGQGAGRYLARKQLAFVGYATPEEAFQSIAQAMVDGDSDKVFACLSPQGQAAIGNQPNGRKNFDANIKRNGQEFKGLQITARKVLADDKVELKFKLDPVSRSKNGGHVPVFLVQAFVKVDSEWKISGDTKTYKPDWDNGSQPVPAS